MVTNRIVGAEALARWQLPDGTLLPPSAFIPLAERTGSIKKLTMQLLARLVRDLEVAGLEEEFNVSFNVTTQDFEDAAFTNALLGLIADGILQSSSLELELELTETWTLSRSALVRKRLQMLIDAGVGLAMDDYGVGYSSLDTLSQWPYD